MLRNPAHINLVCLRRDCCSLLAFPHLGSTSAWKVLTCTSTISVTVSYQGKNWHNTAVPLRPCSSQWVQDPPPMSCHTLFLSAPSPPGLTKSMCFTARNSFLCYLHRLFSLFYCAVFRHLQTFPSLHHLSNSPASPYMSQYHCSPYPAQTQLLRQRQGKMQLRAWCKAWNQSVPGCSNAEPHGRVVQAEQPCRCIRPSTSRVQNAEGKSRG